MQVNQYRLIRTELIRFLCVLSYAGPNSADKPALTILHRLWVFCEADKIPVLTEFICNVHVRFQNWSFPK